MFNAALLSVLLLLLLLMITAHTVFIVLGARSLITGLPVLVHQERRGVGAKGRRYQLGLWYVVFGCVMVVAWGWVAIRVANLLVNSVA